VRKRDMGPIREREIQGQGERHMRCGDRGEVEQYGDRYTRNMGKI
jgi:hypothetical protein